MMAIFKTNINNKKKIINQKDRKLHMNLQLKTVEEIQFFSNNKIINKYNKRNRGSNSSITHKMYKIVILTKLMMMELVLFNQEKVEELNFFIILKNNYN